MSVIEDIKRLRKVSGSGFNDCKKALETANGDFHQAQKILKEMGLSASLNRRERQTSEGALFVKVGEENATLLSLVCETDFVARNQEFQNLGKDLVSFCNTHQMNRLNDEMSEKLSLLSAKIKENLQVSQILSTAKVDNGFFSSYVHDDQKIAAIVSFSGSSGIKDNPIIQDFALDCALHIVAFAPLFLTLDQISSEYQKEQEAIFLKQMENIDKPEAIKCNIIQGKLNKHFQEIVFLKQAFIKDTSFTVESKIEQIKQNLKIDLCINEFIYLNIR